MMPKDWHALYVQLGELLGNMPQDLSGNDPMSNDMRSWMGRACALVALTGDVLEHVKIVGACDHIGLETFRSRSADTIANVLHRSLAMAETHAPASAQGAFIPVGHTFDAFMAIGKILGRATRYSLIVDPYMDEKALTEFAPLSPEGVEVRLLASQKAHGAGLPPAVKLWREQYQDKRPLQARLASARSLHDRLILVDGRDVWTLTQSLNAFAARSPATIARLDAETATLKADAFKAIWDDAEPL